jgi:hypothetical protein
MRAASGWRSALVGLCALWLTPGCFGQGEPDDLFFVFGRVRNAAGTGLSGVKVDALVSKETGCSFFLGDTAIPGAPDFSLLTSATSNAQGDFLFEFYRFQLEDSNGVPRCLKAELKETDGEVRTRAQFYGSTQDVELPALVRWDEGTSGLEQAEAGLQVHMPSPLPFQEFARPGDLRDTSRQLRFYEWHVLAADALAWVSWADGQPLRAGPEVLEDFGPLTLGMEVLSEEYTGDGTPFGGWGYLQMRIKGPQRTVPPTGVVPVSRGAACSRGGVPVEPCTLTDGSLERVEFDFPSGEGGELPAPQETLRLTLARPARLSTFVLRDVGLYGGGEPIRLEGSLDGEHWVELGRPFPEPTWDENEWQRVDGYYRSLTGYRGTYLSAPLDAPAPEVRFVRLVGYPYALFHAREISLFE